MKSRKASELVKAADAIKDTFAHDWNIVQA